MKEKNYEYLLREKWYLNSHYMRIRKFCKCQTKSRKEFIQTVVNSIKKTRENRKTFCQPKHLLANKSSLHAINRNLHVFFMIFHNSPLHFMILLWHKAVWGQICVIRIIFGSIISTWCCNKIIRKKNCK